MFIKRRETVSRTNIMIKMTKKLTVLHRLIESHAMTMTGRTTLNEKFISLMSRQTRIV